MTVDINLADDFAVAGDNAILVDEYDQLGPRFHTAIIGGEMVKLGGKYGDARVIKITESEVVLRSATGTETLRMYPDVTMKPIKPAPAVSDQPVKKNRRPAANTRGKQG